MLRDDTLTMKCRRRWMTHDHLHTRATSVSRLTISGVGLMVCLSTVCLRLLLAPIAHPSACDTCSMSTPVLYRQEADGTTHQGTTLLVLATMIEGTDV